MNVSMQQLPSGAMLQNGKYRIEKVLGQGGFGITYMITQVMLGRKASIKEFFMNEYCERNGYTVTTLITGGKGRIRKVPWKGYPKI